jgi:arylsulfatase A
VFLSTVMSLIGAMIRILALGLTLAMSLPPCPGVELTERLPDGSRCWQRVEGAVAESGIEAGEWRLAEQLSDGSLALFRKSGGNHGTMDASASQPAKVAELRGRLEAWRRAQGAKLPALPSDGKIRLEAREATVSGTKLHYETPPHKDTLGFWVNAADTASWTFKVTEAGKYRVTVLQGCGKGNGGSRVALECGAGRVEFTVEETGHFQRFVAREVGVLELAAGEATLTVRPLAKKGAAVMDLRRVILERAP